MKSLLVIVLLAVLSVRTDAAEIQDLKNPNVPTNISLADPDINIPAPIELFDEVLDILDGEENSLVQGEPVTWTNLVAGNINSSDRRLFRNNYTRNAIANQVRTFNVTYRGESSIRISAVRAWEQGTSQNARASIVAGGLGRNTVTVRLTSALGRGFHYLVEVFGR